MDAADAFERADIEAVLGAAIARAFADELAMRRLVGLGLSRGGDPGLGDDQLLLRFMVCRSRRSQTERTPNGEIATPLLASSLEARVWPCAG